MCNLCNGTHVVHEIDSFSIRVGCCPVCGPEPVEAWKARLNKIATWANGERSKKK